MFGSSDVCLSIVFWAVKAELFSNIRRLIPDFGCSYNDLDAPDEEVTVLDYRSL